MHVVSAASVETPGGWRKVSISLGEEDFVRLVAEGRVKGAWLSEDGEVVTEGGPVSALTVYRVLKGQADALLWSSLAVEGVIPAERAKKLVNEALEFAQVLS
jgi:hypothetical protein